MGHGRFFRLLAFRIHRLFSLVILAKFPRTVLSVDSLNSVLLLLASQRLNPGHCSREKIW